jgi:hypothetical protein
MRKRVTIEPREIDRTTGAAVKDRRQPPRG